MDISARKVIEAARSWVGTKFQHQGRVKTIQSKIDNNHIDNIGGTDCLGLIIGVAKELNLKNKTGIPIFMLDNANYAVFVQSNELYEKISEHLYEVSIMEMKPADIICFKIQNYIKHVAIFSYKNNIIHVTEETGKVVEHALTDYWKKKIAAVFRFKF